MTPRLAKVMRVASRVNRDPRFRGKSTRAKARMALVYSLPLVARFFMHLALVLRHKTYVFLFCAYAGHPWRGFMHDWSKFAPSEFFPSVMYFNGRSSPIGLCREIEGFSFAWLHHKGRNKHHYEFWQDAVTEDGEYVMEPYSFAPIRMPFPYALEMVCDMLSANRVYNSGKNPDYGDALAWWERRRARAPINMHPATERFVDSIFRELARVGNLTPLRRAREFYDASLRDE